MNAEDRIEEFKIKACPICRRTPSPKRQFTEDTAPTDPNRYSMTCCQLTSFGISETQVIVNWNKIAARYENKTAIAV